MTAPEPYVANSRPAGYSIWKRQHCEELRTSLWTERATFDSHWRELSQFILPRRARFTTTDTNKGDKRNQNIIDSTATEAAGTCSAGMHSGVTSPARPWFKLGVPDPDLMEQDDVKEYLHTVETRMQAVMVKSNFYKVLPTLYSDLAVFATGAFSIMEDDETVIRCYDFPLGSFAVANDARREVRTFVRMFRLSVGQVVEQWGNIDKSGRPDFARGAETTISLTVQNLWKRGNTAAWVDLVHVIQPNVSYDGIKAESQYKKYEEVYYEYGTSSGPFAKDSTGVLSHSGYDEFPVITGRWEKAGEDVYGTNCPGMAALGDIKQLQLGEKRIMQAIEKMINPPLVGPSRLNNAKVSVLPGDLTYDDTRDGTAGLRPIYQVNFDVSKLEAKQDQLRKRIQSTFKADLFLMLSQSDRREITAREIDERHEEKLLAIGPTLEQINDDVLDPSIDRIFGIMARKGLLPEPPESLQGMGLKVDYISIMAQAQRMIGLSSLERTASFVGQAAQFAPEVLDVVDMDQLIREHCEATGTPPKVLRSEDDVQQMRAARAKQQQMQQAAENAPNIAGALKDASQASTSGDSVLAKMLNGQNAKQTLNATQQPPAMVA